MAFQAGAGRAAVLFPQEIFPIEGFCGIHDAPHIRVLVLDSGIRAAIAVCELVNVSGDGLSAIRSTVSEQTGTAPENVRVHITHAITTPHIPNDPDRVQNGPKNEHMDDVSAEAARKQRTLFLGALLTAAKQAARQAAGSLCEVKIGFGTGTSMTNINRDIDTPFGPWINLNPEGYSDHELRVLRFERTDGSLLAILANFDLKPCAVDNSEREKNTRLVSSDVPGLASALWEQESGAVCLYTMAASGDQVPREMALLEDVDESGNAYRIDAGVKRGFEMVDRLGRELAGDLKRAAENIACASVAAPIRMCRLSVRCEKKQRMAFRPRLTAEYVPDGTADVDAGLLSFGDIAIVTAKPETNAVTGRALMDRSPFPFTLYLSMTDGDMKYMPDLRSYKRVTWEAQSSMLMPGSAERWLDGVLAGLQAMRAAN